MRDNFAEENLDVWLETDAFKHRWQNVIKTNLAMAKLSREAELSMGYYASYDSCNDDNNKPGEKLTQENITDMKRDCLAIFDKYMRSGSPFEVNLVEEVPIDR